MRQIQTVQGPLWVWDQDQVGAVLEGGAFWDWQLRPIIEEAAEKYPGRAAIDVGASVGWFTIYLAGKFKLVYAWEAHPRTAEILQLNLSERGLLDRVWIYPMVAFDRRTYFSLATPEMLGWPVPEDLNQTPNPSSIGFVMDALGTFLGAPVDHLLDPGVPVGFIKIDAQGADLRAAVGLQACLRRWRPLVAFEYESGPSMWHGDRWEDYQAFWQAEGYSLEELPASNYACRPLELARQ